MEEDENDLILRILSLGHFTHYNGCRFKFQNRTASVFWNHKETYAFESQKVEQERQSFSVNFNFKNVNT